MTNGGGATLAMVDRCDRRVICRRGGGAGGKDKRDSSTGIEEGRLVGANVRIKYLCLVGRERERERDYGKKRDTDSEERLTSNAKVRQKNRNHYDKENYKMEK